MQKLYERIVDLRVKESLRYTEDGTSYYSTNIFETYHAINILAEMHPLLKKQLLTKPLDQLDDNELDELIGNLGKALSEIQKT